MRVVYKLWKNDTIIYIGSGKLSQPEWSMKELLADRFEIVAIVPDGDKELTRMFETVAWMYHTKMGICLENCNQPHRDLGEYHKWLTRSEDTKSGAAQGAAWYASLTEEERRAHNEKVQSARKRSTKKQGRPRKNPASQDSDLGEVL